MDQTDGGTVLARDRGLQRGGLAPGLQLSSVKRSKGVNQIPVDFKAKLCVCDSRKCGREVDMRGDQRMVSQSWIRLM